MTEDELRAMQAAVNNATQEGWDDGRLTGITEVVQAAERGEGPATVAVLRWLGKQPGFCRADTERIQKLADQAAA